ncbi:hypothetical protein [Massilia sp. KIM]|uniref:hypothetical protein n=1 Tax=Massilia sp. KIM TaxID=1955422 RepID=UPI0035A2D6AF
MSCTCVTQLVQQLEASLRVKLLNHTTRKVNATEAGAHLLPARCASSVGSRGRRGRPARQRRHSTRTVAGLMCSGPSPICCWCRPCRAVHLQYPRIRLEMGASDRKVDLIGENVDCVLRGGEIVHGSLVARRIGESGLGIYVALAYFAHAGVPTLPLDRANSLASSHRPFSLG